MLKIQITNYANSVADYVAEKVTIFIGLKHHAVCIRLKNVDTAIFMSRGAVIVSVDNLKQTFWKCAMCKN